MARNTDTDIGDLPELILLLGHKHQKYQFAESLKGNQRTFIFVGPDGVGKRKLARNFIRLVNEIGYDYDSTPVDQIVKDLNSWNDDINTKRWMMGKFPGMLEFDFNDPQVRKIENVRDIIEKVKYNDPKVKRKFVILDNFEELASRSEDVLLKVLEETKIATYILVSNDTEGIRPTIMSRCMELRFNGLSYDDADYIVCGFSEIKYTDPDAVDIMLQLSNGSLGKFRRYIESDVLQIYDLVKDIFSLDLDSVMKVLEALRLKTDGKALRKCTEFLIDYMEFRIFSKVVDSNFKVSKVLDYFEEHARKMRHMLKAIQGSVNTFYQMEIYLRFWLLTFAGGIKSTSK